MMNHGMMGGMMLLWIVVLAFLFVAVNRLLNFSRYRYAEISAAEALDLRLAKGEISAAEYDEIKNRLL
ncbi:hypothetical protein [Ectobacillus ponti]|uniref:SHOCT domain-containing protein n=1 Tax=Ectobacillus ponti TaxID=2961894 RepID=A0AA41X5V7_9BACI|nr:hypothetical protein [Ectobacillus ponti]MCP8969247.1 hypothetical protein [Ectobacillus ponti]